MRYLCFQQNTVASVHRYNLWVVHFYFCMYVVCLVTLNMICAFMRECDGILSSWSLPL